MSARTVEMAVRAVWGMDMPSMKLFPELGGEGGSQHGERAYGYGYEGSGRSSGRIGRGGGACT